MIEVPFCYKVWGLAEDEEGNKDYAYIKLTLNVKKKPDKEKYKELHRACVKILPIEENVELIDIKEYLENTECDSEEISKLKNKIVKK